MQLGSEPDPTPREAMTWKDIIPGRCEQLHVSLPLSGSVSVSVLDAPAHLQPTRPFAALLVPREQEQDWMFCTSNGLWDLLFSSSVSRLVVLRRLSLAHGGGDENTENPATWFTDAIIHNLCQIPGIIHSHPLSIPSATADDYDDDGSFKKLFSPLLSSLFPWNHCPLGPLSDPYVVYEDNVVERLVVEMRHSEALGSDILVEDVELACSTDEALGGAEPNKRELRRRMRFHQMPNLIQTEVSVTLYKDGHRDSTHGLQDVRLLQERHNAAGMSDNVSSVQNHEVFQTDLEVRPDHSKLVHKYLPPIVAGLVLASPCLAACIEANTRARVLTIGLGGGALPFFLHKQFGFSVLAVDTDETVVELARQHFGFIENEHLQVQIRDGIKVVYSIAHQACRNSLESKEVLREWEEASRDYDQETSTVSVHDDPRMHVIVVDVCASDARLGLLSPPLDFLTDTFLLAVQLGLHKGGMLVINVIPRAEQNLRFVAESLRKFFAGIYRIQSDDNHVLFAFRSKIADINMSCSFARLVAHAVGEGFFDHIEEVDHL
ncbi:hypothetical protein GOP47_0023291 [Adiantum capillus-veneris]|uniref:Methyltransferase-like protein 13 n=1 Tax=Adiantum capillus-veneris TaxID=13818 RepID=A0A9D4Z6T8_ADICA|nr:hypothetical protein GOP47_0023291 [Adiantum capillus-veneris]